MTDADGPNPNSPCQLPFKFGGISYNKCLFDQSGKYWCPTALNDDQEYVGGANNWGFCLASSCPIHDENHEKSAELPAKKGAIFSATSIAWKSKTIFLRI